MMQRHNICTLTDGYKLTHHKQYLPGTSGVYSYFESRLGAKWDTTVFFGLQYILMKYMTGQVVTRDKIEQAAKRSANYFGDPSLFNREMWERILARHDGYLPVVIKAVPEGTVVPVSNVLMTVENTDDDIAGPLTNHLETILSQVWYPSTVATLSREVKKVILPYMQKSMSPEAVEQAIMFMLHDFGFRGATSVESAAWGGAAHLLNFLGTDTLPALDLLEDYYDAEDPGVSVPATEHSVMTAGGRKGEVDVVGHLLKTHPKGILSIVADSYNVYDFCDKTLGITYRDQILKRDGVVVARPDSGEPKEVLPACLQRLARRFGVHTNEQGYQELPPQIKVLWGDGLQLGPIDELCDVVTKAGWSMSNIATFGMGGGLLQRVHRDTQRFAFKCSAQKRDGVWHDIYKDPIDQSKASKKGTLALVYGDDHQLTTVPEHRATENDLGKDQLQMVFMNGQMMKYNDLTGMRKRCEL